MKSQTYSPIALGIACGALLVLVGVTPARAQLVNGDFETGDLSGWTSYTTANGTIGAETGYPTVEVFDTVSGIPSPAAAFKVGVDTVVVAGGGGAEGGGIYQDANLIAGNYMLSADIAVLDSEGSNNADGGLFELLFDGAVVDYFGFGEVVVNVSEHSMLSAVRVSTAGVHEVRLRMTRNFTNGFGAPVQYLDNIRLAIVPEPTSAVLLMMGGVVASWAVRRSRR